MPATRRGQTFSLLGMATVWVLAYWVNGRMWDSIFYDVLGMAPADRLASSLHFFFYDVTKIAASCRG